MRRLGVLVALALTLATGCSRGSEPAATAAGLGTVDHPVDGDTVVVDVGGSTTSVRLIGIDTPESVSQDVPVECFGPEAKARLAELLPPGTPVRLERDVEARDQYDRLLAYVYRADDDAFVNLLLVEEGYAEAFPFEPNTAHEADFAAAEQRARDSDRGLWPACGGTDTPAGSRAG